MFVYTIIFEWDEEKRINNVEKHGVDFSIVQELWNSSMLVVEDTRYQYNEKRWIAMTEFKKRVMVIVYTKRRLNTVRIISLRKANKREINYYDRYSEKK
jgi:uncharacterized DUF497 family protein